MAPSIPPCSSPEKPHHGFPFAPLSAARSIQSLAAGVLSRLPFGPHNPAVSSYKSTAPPSSSAVALPAPVLLPFDSSYSSGPILSGYHQVSGCAASAVRRLPSSVRIDGLGPGPKGGGDGGPAFVGQVFSMLDPSGNGLMAVTTHWHIPFLSKRTPEWFKKMLAAVTKSDRNGPVFRFFMDLSDAVAYVKRLNIPTGMVGACRLDVAYEHFKEKPHMFQFVPNEKQVKAANKLLKTIPRKSGKRKLNGVPVFTAQNLNIAIATNDGIKWYTPYFFDKSLLDNILEASIDQHFHTLIQNRHMQRRRDVIDDNLTAEIVEENGERFFEPPEVQEVLDEMGHPGVPLSVISKAAEIQLLDVIDKVLLGNKWLRKATGIQPKFPYVVDSFEQRSAASLQKTAVSLSSAPDLDTVDDKLPQLQLGATEVKLNDTAQGEQGHLTDHTDFRFPFGDWFLNPWSHLHGKHQKPDDQDADTRSSRLARDGIKQAPSNPLLPKITMVGISMGEGGQMSKASLKKTMDELTKELESNQGSSKLNEDRDPLFVANVGDYSGIMRMNSA